LVGGKKKKSLGTRKGGGPKRPCPPSKSWASKRSFLPKKRGPATKRGSRSGEVSGQKKKRKGGKRLNSKTRP